LGIAGMAFTAEQAAAQTVTPRIPSLPPGQGAETIGPAATIVSTVHYQVKVPLSCNIAACEANFPRPGRNRLITVTRLSCAFVVSNNSPILIVSADDVDSKNTHSIQEYLPIAYTYPQGYNIINQAIDMQIVGTHHLDLIIDFSAGNASSSSGACTASGTLSTMQ
jgi:hypothetical protein